MFQIEKNKKEKKKKKKKKRKEMCEEKEKKIEGKKPIYLHVHSVQLVFCQIL